MPGLTEVHAARAILESLDLRRDCRRVLLTVVVLYCGFFLFELILDSVSPNPIDDLSRFGASREVFSADGTAMQVTPTVRSERLLPLNPGGVSDSVRMAIIAAEDGRFDSHSGVDVISCGRAAWQLLTNGRIVSGASTLSMQTVMQTAARLYRLGYAEIWHMVTINAAASLGRGRDRGSLEPGKRADIVIWRVPDHGMVIHRFGTNLADVVLIGGRRIVEGGRLAT